MELLSHGRSLINLKRKCRRRRKYKRLDSSVESRKNIKIVRFGANPKRVWKVRKLRIKTASPLKLWKKFKNAYMNMMIYMSGRVGALNYGGGSVLGGKRIPEARPVPLAYDKNQFENRLIYEIYKSLVVSMELNPR